MTKLGGTIVKDGLTTVHETNVIGTFINGKYAQVLQSSSKVLNSADPVYEQKKIRPTASQRILKTIGPHHGKLKNLPKQHHQQQEYTTESQEDQTTEGPTGPPVRRNSGNQNRPKYRTNKVIEDIETTSAEPTRAPTKNRSPSRSGFK